MFIYTYMYIYIYQSGQSRLAPHNPKQNSMHGMTEFRDYLFGLTIASPLVVLVRGLDKVWNPRKADIARKGKSGEFQSLPKLQWMEEILHQLMGGLSHYLCGFNPPRWCRISSIKPYQTRKFMKIPLRRQIIYEFSAALQNGSVPMFPISRDAVWAPGCAETFDSKTCGGCWR